MTPPDAPLRIKLQLFRGGERALGPGRADVLAAIDRTGSISGAGRALGMSYRYTWLLVDSMNRCFEDRVVETATGGARRGVIAAPLMGSVWPAVPTTTITTTTTTTIVMITAITMSTTIVVPVAISVV